ncbi:hypothetical protein WMY93_015075 [Mugilogobius chulae]|uniref:BTB domain-containing protein n=1 Tax=Mugilogobius chulae TaxID=88201 RepID=A0AAW0P637_9GOBI
MAVANPWMHQSWSECKKEREEGRKRRLSWMQRVMRWDKLNANGESQEEPDDDEDGDVSDEELGEKRLEDSRKIVETQSERQDLEQNKQAEIGKKLEELQRIGSDDDDENFKSVSDEEIQDSRLEGHRKKIEKRKARRGLEECEQAKVVKEWQKTELENQDASGSLEQDFERENQSASATFNRLSPHSDSLISSENDSVQLQQTEKHFEDFDDVSDNLEESLLDVAIAGPMEVANHNNFLFEVRFKTKDHLKRSRDKDDVTNNGQGEETDVKELEQQLEFHSSSQSSTSGISENRERYSEKSYNQVIKETRDVDTNCKDVGESAATPRDEFEFCHPHNSENDGQCSEQSYYQDSDVNRLECQAEVEEFASKWKDGSEFDYLSQYSTSVSENWEYFDEASCSQEPKYLEGRSFEKLTKDGGARWQEVDDLAANPKDDMGDSNQNSASTCFENWRRFYEVRYNQDTEEDADLNANRSEDLTEDSSELDFGEFQYLTEDGSENRQQGYAEFYNVVEETAKDLEVNGMEDLTNDDEFKTSMQEEVEEVAKQTADEHLTEEETTTTDEDDDVLGDEDTDCYDLNEIKLYKQDNHANEIFQTLAEFKDAQILTDLKLKTSDGKSMYVHAIVLSAVSFLARRYLNKQHIWFWDRKTEEIVVGPEVEFEALEAVVEFAYTGAIKCLNGLNVGEIKTAARFLSAPRIMELCDRELSKAKSKSKEKIVPVSTELRKNLQSIEELWSHEMGCDVTLDVLSASFQVHKVILAACSDYFRAMFTLGMRESSQSSVYLQFLSAPELEALLDCSYTGSISLSWNCIFEITSTALQLQYQPALDLCLRFLQREINPHSCLDVASFAEAFGIVKLLDHAEDYVLRQFQKVSRTPKFKDLPSRNLLRYLNSFALCVPSELVVFRAVVDWIQAKPKRRLKLAKELMKTIHFPLMTFKEFKEVQALNMWSNDSLKELYEAIFEDFCSNEIETQSKCRIYLPKESLVLSGGDQISEDLGTRSVSKDLWFGNSLRNHTGIKKAMEWRQLGEMPEPARFSHEVAVIQGQLYMLGGKKYYGTGDTLNSFYRYDPLENSWEELPSMHQARCSFSLVVLESKLYAIGGQCHPDYLETVEQYCPSANSWSFACPLDLPLGGHVARVFTGQIYISGGLNNDYNCLSSMLAYHPEKGSTYLENMSHPRALHCMEVLGEFLFVAGGLSQTDSAGVIDMLACEMYNPEADSWTCFSSLPVPHVGAGSSVLEGKFYVLGGYSQEDYSDTKMVHRYDPATEQWENMGKMPGPNNDLRACVLSLPEHLRLCPDET